jgi:hypothetical protein
MPAIDIKEFPMRHAKSFAPAMRDYEAYKLFSEAGDTNFA